MNLLDNLKETYRQGTVAIRLIFINVAVYAILQLLLIFLKLFIINGEGIFQWLALPASFGQLLFYPWTLISYMFLHKDLFHLAFNMIALYWFGKLFLMYHTGKQLTGLYLLGGLTAGLLYMLFYNLFPLFQGMTGFSVLMGASGSIMAIIVATAMQAPNMELRFFLLGNVKLKYIALVAVLISLFSITSSNAGGEIAHLGGALYGYIFIVSLRRGKDLTRRTSRLIDSLTTLFKPRKLKVKKGGGQRTKMTDAEYNMHKAKSMAEIDRILDKVKASGYSSLTEEEKNTLFQQRKN
ncbi:MAG: rhomboid family intramembrane serine protease [Paludibacter sp.]|jgi:membrane associated rhomboid family serine protease|nr:rhomboid family intramembrane serine protease [Paludibacter sp.]